jgi:hypothetical protein
MSRIGTGRRLLSQQPQEPRQPLALLKRIRRRCPLAPIAVTKEAAS